MSDLVSALQGANRSSSVLGAIANPAQVNPLAAYGAAAETASRMYQARDLQAQQLVGEAYQNSLRDGVPDQQQFNRNIVAAGPNAAMRALSGSQQGVTLDKDTFDLHNKRVAGVSLALSQLTADYPNGVPLEAIQKTIDDQLKAGNITPEMAAQQSSVYGADPHANSRAIVQQQYRLLQAQEALNNNRPTTSLTNTGTAVVPLNLPPVGSTTQRQGTVTQGGGGAYIGPSPQELAAPFTWKDEKTGKELTKPYGEFLTDHGFKLPGYGGSKPGDGSVPPSLRNPANTQPSAQPAPAPGSGTTPAPTPTPTPPAVTAPSAGQTEKWKASAASYSADAAAAGDFQSRIFPLVQSHALLESGNVTTGPGSEGWQRVKGLLTTAAGQFNWNPNEINNADADKLNKYLTQYTNSLPFAGASDARLASALSGNPNMHINTLANKDVVKALIGLERMKQTVVSDFQASGADPNTYSDYKLQWQNTHDPRAFVFDMMGNDQRAKMVRGMSDAERQRFNDTLQLVRNNPGIMGQAAMPGH